MHVFVQGGVEEGAGSPTHVYTSGREAGTCMHVWGLDLLCEPFRCHALHHTHRVCVTALTLTAPQGRPPAPPWLSVPTRPAQAPQSATHGLCHCQQLLSCCCWHCLFKGEMLSPTRAAAVRFAQRSSAQRSAAAQQTQATVTWCTLCTAQRSTSP